MYTIICATTRPENMTQKVAIIFGEILTDINTAFQIVTPADFDLPYDGAKDPIWTQIVNDSDGFILITPEYNHSFPGKLKTLLDSEYSAYANKKVLICTVSSGGFGGVRAGLALLPILHKFGMRVYQSDLAISFVDKTLEDPAMLNEWTKKAAETTQKFIA